MTDLAKFVDHPEQLRTEVVVNHRLGYVAPPDFFDLPAFQCMPQEEIDKADAMLEAYVQQRIAQEKS